MIPISKKTTYYSGIIEIPFGYLVTTGDQEEINDLDEYTMKYAAGSFIILDSNFQAIPFLDFHDFTNAEIYDFGLNTKSIELVIDGRDNLSSSFILHQNNPNPFGQSTTISFELPSKEDVRLTVMDVTGKIVSVLNRSFEKGINQISLDRDQMGASGVMYYQLEAGNFIATKKMIMID